MRRISAILLACLAVPAVPASAAECASEFSAILSAMNSGVPMRREDVVTKNGALIEKMVLDMSPPDQLRRVTESSGGSVTKMFVSGKKAWTVFKGLGKPEDPPQAIDGPGAADSVLRDAMGMQETDAPLIDCPIDGNGILTLTWKGENSDKSVFNVASVDAKTHMVKILTRNTLDKYDNAKYQRKSTYRVIPAFTVAEPAP